MCEAAPCMDSKPSKSHDVVALERNQVPVRVMMMMGIVTMMTILMIIVILVTIITIITITLIYLVYPSIHHPTTEPAADAEGEGECVGRVGRTSEPHAHQPLLVCCRQKRTQVAEGRRTTSVCEDRFARVGV